MTKKEYVLKVLDKVKGYWAKEPMIRTYIDTHDDEKYINYLYDKFVVAVKNTLKKQETEKLQALTKNLDILKSKESDSYLADEEDLKKLDELLLDM
ncbi:MAG: hypothetical protein PHR61_02785 [Candidatus Absconditabacteria bacterium]|nr:hypothetical protein [Candidatus Absconditabacteria bacterium]